jgi:hypothetical protein
LQAPGEDGEGDGEDDEDDDEDDGEDNDDDDDDKCGDSNPPFSLRYLALSLAAFLCATAFRALKSTICVSQPLICSW